jgi:hypothetical protein
VSEVLLERNCPLVLPQTGLCDNTIPVRPAETWLPVVAERMLPIGTWR